MTRSSAARVRLRTSRPRGDGLLATLACALALLAVQPAAGAGTVVVVPPDAPMRFAANAGPPPFGSDWVAPGFDDSAWPAGTFGVGYETNALGAAELIDTVVPTGTRSVYARTSFDLTGLAVESVHLGLDHDDGVVAWINGVEVYRSPQMPPGPPVWDTVALDHESSNDYVPRLVPRIDITAAALPALAPGDNVLAIGVWNTGPASSDLVVVPRLSVNETLALVRDPYLQLAAERSIRVRWRTNLPSSSTVAYGPAPDRLTFVRESGIRTTEHSLTLTGLEPETTYYYSVGGDDVVLAGEDAAHRFRTAPPRGEARPTRIWVLGDSGTGSAAARAVRDAYYDATAYRDTDLWLMLGDNAYPDGTDGNYQVKLFDVFGDMLRRTVLWPTLGNHELIRGSVVGETAAYFDIFDLPAGHQADGPASGTEAYYAFDHANVHFVVLDSNDSDRSVNGPMLSWLAADLASNSQDWLIAYWHHSPYSHGSHDSDSELQLIEMRENVVPLLESHGVDLVLTAHSHSYERSFLIDGHHDVSGTFGPSMLVDGGDGDARGDGAYAKATLGPEPHTGAVYTVTGSAGQVSGGALDHPAMVRSFNVLGSVIVEIDGGRLDARFLDDGGAVRDSFTIIKGCANPNLRFTSHPPHGAGSDVVTPGVCDGGLPCDSDSGSTVSNEVRGAFWSTGHGDPAPGAGIDSGRYPAWAADDTGWLHTPAGDGAFIDGNWAVDPRIDGCAGDPPAPRCMTAALTDQDAGVGYFALLTAPEEAGSLVSFARPGGAPLVLGALPVPLVVGTAPLNGHQMRVETIPAALGRGVYADAACPSGQPIGYRIYEQRTSRGGTFATDRRLGEADDGVWALAAGGQAPDGAPWPLDTSAVVTLTCHTAVDLALGTSLVFEGGFQTAVVSADSARIACGDCEFDDDLDGACGRYLAGQDGPDCDDGAAAVFPGAEQVCGDHLNNDCDHPTWPSLVGTNEIDDDGDGFTECQGDCRDDAIEVWGVPGAATALEFRQDGQSLAWDGPDDLGGLAVAFDTLRSPDPFDFGAGALCVEADFGLPFAIDPAVPPPGTGFYYLVRAKNACGSTLGTDSAGRPRVARSCS